MGIWFTIFLVANTVLGIVLFLLGTNHHIKSIQRKAKRNPEEVSKYGKNIIIGLVSGGIVIILDRFVNIIINSASNVETGLLLNIWYLLSLLLGLVFFITLMIFLIFYIISKGMKH